MSLQDQVVSVLRDFGGSVLHDPAVQAGLRLMAWGLLILWVVTVLWAFRDALARTHNVLVVLGAPATILIATPMAFPLAVVVWRILRPAQTVVETDEQQLTIDALGASIRKPTCFGCGSRVDAQWRRCPWCRTWLQAPCPRCRRLVELDAQICPWCVLDLAEGALRPHVGPPSLVPVMAVSAAMVPVIGPAAVESESAPAARPVRRQRHEAAVMEPTSSRSAAAAAIAAESVISPEVAIATEAVIEPTQPRRSRRSRSRSGAQDLRRQPEEPARSPTALW